MINLLKAEFYKLFHSRYFPGLCLAQLVFSTTMIRDSVPKTSNLFYATLWYLPFSYLIVVVFMVMHFANDYEERTLFQYITAGNKRGSVFLAKTITFVVGCLFIMALPIALQLLIGGWILNQTVDPALIRQYTGILLMGQAATAMLGVCLSNLFKKTGNLITAGMITFIVIVIALNGKAAQLLSTVLPMGHAYRIAAEMITETPGYYMGISAGWIAVCGIVALLAFRRADLK